MMFGEVQVDVDIENRKKENKSRYCGSRAGETICFQIKQVDACLSFKIKTKNDKIFFSKRANPKNLIRLEFYFFLPVPLL